MIQRIYQATRATQDRQVTQVSQPQHREQVDFQDLAEPIPVRLGTLGFAVKAELPDIQGILVADKAVIQVSLDSVVLVVDQGFRATRGSADVRDIQGSRGTQVFLAGVVTRDSLAPDVAGSLGIRGQEQADSPDTADALGTVDFLRLVPVHPGSVDSPDHQVTVVTLRFPVTLGFPDFQVQVVEEELAGFQATRASVVYPGTVVFADSAVTLDSAVLAGIPVSAGTRDTQGIQAGVVTRASAGLGLDYLEQLHKFQEQTSLPLAPHLLT